MQSFDTQKAILSIILPLQLQQVQGIVIAPGLQNVQAFRLDLKWKVILSASIAMLSNATSQNVWFGFRPVHSWLPIYLAPKRKDLHNLPAVPKHTVCVVVNCRVKPQKDALLPLSGAICKHVCLQNVRLPRDISEKLKVEFIVVTRRRGELLWTKGHEMCAHIISE